MKHAMSLGSKLTALSAVIMIPLAIIVVYLIGALVNCGNGYNNIVKNISIASGYNFTFRDDVDNTVYRIVINGMVYDELVQKEINQLGFEREYLKNPYQTINHAKTAFIKLSEKGVNSENKSSVAQLKWIVESIERLEVIVKTVEQNIRMQKPYRENQKLMNSAVYILTEDIQEAIQQYIQDEAQEMERVAEELKKQQDRAVSISVYALCFILGISLFVSRKITFSITRPIKDLCAATEAVARGDFTSKTEIVAGDEIQVLTTSINHMKIELGHLIEDVKAEKDNLRLTELKLLQAQINPHFLYNTLDAIVWLSESNQTKQLIDMVTSLSEFFRTVLSNGKDLITVQEEMSHVKSYLAIQQIRYEDILDYEIKLDEKLNTFPILKLTLQPIVENALYHGIKNKRGKGKIVVSAVLDGDNMVFKIEDNGVGMTPEELHRIRNLAKSRGNEGRDGFALSNVDERIQMAYGLEYGITFESIKGLGTTVTVTLPAVEIF